MVASQKFAVFDIDGTLIRWQLYHVMVDKLAGKGLLGPDAKDLLRDARMKWKRREHPEAFAEYEQTLIGIYEAGVPMLKADAFDAAIEGVIDEYKDQVYTYTRDLVSQLKAEGYLILAISGSHQELVERVAEYYGFDDCAGSVYKREGTHFTGEKFVGSHDKQAVLEKLIDSHQLTTDDSYAIGDSKSDAAMLRLVDHPIAFNPDRALLETAQEQGWDIVIERKNVIYKLRKQHGHYQLLA